MPDLNEPGASAVSKGARVMLAREEGLAEVTGRLTDQYIFVARIVDDGGEPCFTQPVLRMIGDVASVDRTMVSNRPITRSLVILVT